MVSRSGSSNGCLHQVMTRLNSSLFWVFPASERKLPLKCARFQEYRRKNRQKIADTLNAAVRLEVCPTCRAQPCDPLQGACFACAAKGVGDVGVRAHDGTIACGIESASTIKELASRWYPAAMAAAPRKSGGHRALDDIRESLAELAYYRSSVFRDPPTP